MKDTTENNETKPKIGEFWYVSGFYNGDAPLGKILAITDKECVIRFTWGTKLIVLTRLIAKYVPNRFWRILGYK